MGVNRINMDPEKYHLYNFIPQGHQTVMAFDVHQVVVLDNKYSVNIDFLMEMLPVKLAYKYWILAKQFNLYLYQAKYITVDDLPLHYIHNKSPVGLIQS